MLVDEQWLLLGFTAFAKTAPHLPMDISSAVVPLPLKQEQPGSSHYKVGFVGNTVVSQEARSERARAGARKARTFVAFKFTCKADSKG
jgi:hypothetical protein